MLSHARQLQKGRDSSMSALIDARGIEKSFMYGKGKKLRKNRVLNGIDFSVNVGEPESISSRPERQFNMVVFPDHGYPCKFRSLYYTHRMSMMQID